MNQLQLCASALLALASTGCVSLSGAERQHAEAVTEAARSTQIVCAQPNACALPSSLRALATRAFAQSTPAAPRHYALMLDRGDDAMLARINLIRSATTSIDVQTYIFEEDDAGHLMLEELVAAARRGVHVRLLIDQLSALQRVDTLAALAGAHTDFAIRIYNPVLRRARISYPQYLLAAACCWRHLNQRMHTKLLLVDDAVGITGGRNYADDYYDWSTTYNFRDRDVLVAGPVAREMAINFNAFWADERSWPVEALSDVGQRILQQGVPPLGSPVLENAGRVEAFSRAASDDALVRTRLVDHALAVGTVDYIADLPQKHNDQGPKPAPASRGLRELVTAAHDEVLLQTPYLILSSAAQRMFRAMHRQPASPRIIVSTNSLASTDSFITYALSYKYKRRFLRDLGFEIHELKPFPADVPDPALSVAPPPDPAVAAQGSAMTDVAPTPASPPSAGHRHRRGNSGSIIDRFSTPLQTEYASAATRRHNLQPVPLQHAGARVGLHAKSLVVDTRYAVIGTHNFDPRSDHYNTEAAVVIDDPAFARELAASIGRDIAPGNSWTIAPRENVPVFSGVEYSLAKLSERLPIFDLWPVRYATTYEFTPGPQCPAPLPPSDPAFRDCYRAVGDFPEVNISLKAVMTRIFTAFGAGFAPVL